MNILKKSVAVISALIMTVTLQNVPALASEVADNLGALLLVKDSRLLVEDYTRLAIAKTDTEIFNNKGEVIGILPQDAAGDIVGLNNEDAMYEIVSGNIRGLVATDSVIIDSMANIRALRLLDEAAQGAGKQLSYDKKTIIVDKDNNTKSFEISIDGQLAKAVSLVKPEDTKENEVKETQEDKKENTKQEEVKKYKRNIKCSKADLDLMAAIIHCEAGNQSYEGKLAVANVILNRVEDGNFPNSIRGVIYQPRQFTPARNGILKRIMKQGAPKGCYKAAKDALDGKNNVKGYLYFDGRIHKSGYKKISAHYFWKSPW